MAVGEADKEIAQISVGVDAVHFARADETGKPGPIAAAIVMTSKKRIASIHGRAAYSIFHQIGIDVDLAVIQEQPEAVLTTEHISQRLAQIGFARDTLCLGNPPVFNGARQ